MNASHFGDQHLGVDAEVYALGALDAPERAAVESHVAQCAECARRVAAASETATALAASLPAYEPPRSLEARLGLSDAPARAPRRAWWWTALLAATAVLAGILGWQNIEVQQERARTTVALATIVHSHFKHVTMTSSSPGAPAAKILYARDGGWVYIVMDRPLGGVHVILWRDDVGQDAGNLVPSGGVSTLFLPNAGRPRRISLEEPLGVRASATLTY